MGDVGFTSNDIEHVASLLAIICKFGALVFDGTAEEDGSQLSDPDQLEQLADVLGVDAHCLLDALTTTTTVVREETFVNGHSVDKVGRRTVGGV
jgi:myosin heavy subunit